MSPRLTDKYQFDFSNYHIDSNNSEGYFARCYRGVDISLNKCVAIKYLRHELPHPKTGKLVSPFDVHFEAFCREAEFLQLLSSGNSDGKKIARVPYLYSMGYLNGLVATKDQENPTDGEIEEINNIGDYKKQAGDRMKDGWRPYLSIEYFPVQKNMQQIHEFYVKLFPKLSISQSNGKTYPHLPLIQVLLFTIQIARIFKLIHRNPKEQGGAFFYPDSKLPHFFWNGTQAAMIDWNRVWYLKEKGKHEFVYAGLSEETDIQHFISVPVYALLTGRNPAGKQPFFGHDAEPPNYNAELEIIRQGYPDGIYQLFKDVLIADGVIKDALTLENRCEWLLDELFDYSMGEGEENALPGLQDVLANLDQANSLITKSWDVFRDRYLFSETPDVNYINSILDYVKDRIVVPWANNDHCSGNF